MNGDGREAVFRQDRANISSNKMSIATNMGGNKSFIGKFY